MPTEDEDASLGEGLTCFVVSPIGSKLSPVGTASRVTYEDSIQIWENVLEPACAALGLQPIRSDKMSEPGEIPDQIFQLLRDSDVVIADLTGGNANVMYELGLRHTRDRLTIQIGEYERLPFDVNTIRTIQYTRTESGLIDLRNSLTASLRSGLTGHGTPVTATRVWSELAPDRSALDAAVAVSAAPDTDLDGLEEEDAPGFVDVLAEGESSMHAVADDMAVANSAIIEIGNIFTGGGEKIAESDGQGKGFAGRVMVARGISDELQSPSDNLENAAISFGGHVDQVDAMLQFIFERVAAGQEDVDSDDMSEFFDGIESLAEAAVESEPSVAVMLEQTRNLPKVSKVLAPTSKKIGGALNRFLKSMRIMAVWGERARELRADGEPS